MQEYCSRLTCTRTRSHTRSHSLPRVTWRTGSGPNVPAQGPRSPTAGHGSGPCQVRVAKPTRPPLPGLSLGSLYETHRPTYPGLEGRPKPTCSLLPGPPTPGHTVAGPAAYLSLKGLSDAPQCLPTATRPDSWGPVFPPSSHGPPSPQPPSGPQTPALPGGLCTSVPSVWDTSTLIHLPFPGPQPPLPRSVSTKKLLRGWDHTLPRYRPVPRRSTQPSGSDLR